MSAKRLDIVGLGLATIDIMTLVPRLPDHDEVFPARRILLQGGGPVATALVAAARLGAATAYLGPYRAHDLGHSHPRRAGERGGRHEPRPGPRRRRAGGVGHPRRQAPGQRSILYDTGRRAGAVAGRGARRADRLGARAAPRRRPSGGSLPRRRDCPPGRRRRLFRRRSGRAVGRGLSGCCPWSI